MAVSRLPSEVGYESYFRVSKCEVSEWHDGYTPSPSEVHLRMEVVGAPGPVILELRTPRQADELIRDYAIRIAVRPNHQARMVVLDFGETKVSWVAIPLERVEALVVAIAEAVAELKGGG